jgi:single-strand DNA-binding protein
MNKIILTGRTTKDSEIGYLPGIGVAKMTFTMAVDRNYQKDKNNKKVDFINCEIIGKHTENLYKYVSKGKSILVEGELNIDNYEKDNTGNEINNNLISALVSKAKTEHLNVISLMRENFVVEVVKI